MKIWIAYGSDSLPIAIAESAKELASIVGCTTMTIYKAVQRHSERFAQVDIEEKEKQL